MTNTLTDTAYDLLDEQLTTAYKARNVVDAWDIHVTDTVSKYNEFKGALDAANVAYSVRYVQPKPEGAPGVTNTSGYGWGYHEFENLSDTRVVARFTVAMNEIVKYVERDAN